METFNFCMKEFEVKYKHKKIITETNLNIASTNNRRSTIFHTLYMPEINEDSATYRSDEIKSDRNS